MRIRLSGLALANLSLAALILCAGLPGALAAWRRLPVEPLIGALDAGARLPWRSVAAALPALDAAAATSPAAAGESGFARLGILADPEFPPARRPGMARRAAVAFRAALAGVPGDARGWAGLAEAELLAGDPAAAAGALRMSILTAPRNLALILWRCDFGLALYAAFDAETRDLFAGQIRAAAEANPAALARLARTRHMESAIALLLADRPAALARYQAALVHAG